jgi:predicted nucleotidyltransferase
VKRLLWLWPAIIILSTVAAGLVAFVLTDTAVRPFIILWFLFVCPGMALVRFFRLEDLVVEWILALALSFAVDAIAAGALLYAGSWSPTTILGILMGISLGGAILQIGLDPLIKLIGRTRVSSELDYSADLEKTQVLLCMCGYVDDRPGGRFCSRCGKPKSKQARLPTPIQPLIDAYLHALEPLCSHFYGIYIFGSIAFGGFEELESDIDILALTHGEWSAPELAQLKTLHTKLIRTHQLGKRLEVLYIPLHNLGKCDREIPPYPTLQFGKFSPAKYYDLNHVTWWTVKNKGIRLLGPERSTLPFEVVWQDVLETMRDSLNGYWASKTKHSYLFLLDGWIVDAVATHCRILTTIEEGEIITKSVALKRWRERLPARWRPLIDEAWRIRHHLHEPSLYHSRLERMREVLAFIKYVRERGRKVLEAVPKDEKFKLYPLCLPFRKEI